MTYFAQIELFCQQIHRLFDVLLLSLILSITCAYLPSDGMCRWVIAPFFVRWNNLNFFAENY